MDRKPALQIEYLIQDPSFIEWVHGEHNPRTQAWEYRYQNNPEARVLMDQAKVVVEGIPFNRRFISDGKVALAWQKIEKALDQVDEKDPHRIHSFGAIWKIAAAVIIVMIAGTALYFNYKNGEQVYYSDFGQRMEITLPDGSHVTMNANSSLSFVRRNPRNVTMTGEVYFDIAKKPKTGEPFIVHTPDLDIQVLGTEFNVNSRQEKTEVLLEEGSIELNMKEQKKLLMKPGDFVSYSLAKNTILEHQTNQKTEVITSWKEGVLLLDSISLESTLSLLEQTYNVTTIIQNEELSGKILVGGVPNDNLEMCVRALRTIYNLEIELKADSLIVR